MCPALDLKGRTETSMEASTSKDHINVVQMAEDKITKCASNSECKFDMGTSPSEQKRKREDVEVDIINNISDFEIASVQPKYEDATESSSSFGDTFSEDMNRGDGSDDEVVSELRGDATTMVGYGGSGHLFPMREKRLTSHWRTFIQPLMWRCKWVELQIKKFQSQALKYDEELERENQRKQLQYGNTEMEDLAIKSIPFSQCSPRQKGMIRKNRRRHEDEDTEAYMSNLNLFSYFANRKSFTGGATINDEIANLVASADKNVNSELRVSDELLSLDFRDDEYSLEQILWKIEVAQLQVSEMKTKLNTVMTENTERFAAIDELTLRVPDNPLTSPVKECASPNAFASELMEDIQVKVKDENPDSSHGEGTSLPNIIEHTDEPPVGASRKITTDGILIYNRRAKKLRTDSGGAKIHPIEKLQVPKEEKSEDTAPISDELNKKEPAPKLRSISKLTATNNKRKRATRPRRKASSSHWSRRASG